MGLNPSKTSHQDFVKFLNFMYPKRLDKSSEFYVYYGNWLKRNEPKKFEEDYLSWRKARLFMNA